MRVDIILISMATKNKQYSSVEAKKIVDEYIDQSAVRLAQRLKKGYAVQKKQVAKAHAYA